MLPTGFQNKKTMLIHIKSLMIFLIQLLLLLFVYVVFLLLLLKPFFTMLPVFSIVTKNTPKYNHNIIFLVFHLEFFHRVQNIIINVGGPINKVQKTCGTFCGSIHDKTCMIYTVVLSIYSVLNTNYLSFMTSTLKIYERQNYTLPLLNYFNVEDVAEQVIMYHIVYP